jgi:pyruvate,water dikinase
VREQILAAPLSGGLERAITAAYDQLGAEGHGALDVAVRSSATAEDLPDASFAGQQETYLNVRGHAALLDACKRCLASLFTDRAISYRVDKGFDHSAIALSIGVQQMVRADLAAAGVMFTIDTESGFPNVVLINAAYGLGETVVQGAVNPDEYYVFKPTLGRRFRPILQKRLGTKEFKLVYAEGGAKLLQPVPVPVDDRARFALSDDEILTLARWACLIEDHYRTKRGVPSPMNIEWAKDGRTGHLFVVQARPETVHSQRAPDVLETYRLVEHGPVLVTGRSVGAKIAHGPVRVVTRVQDLQEFREGDVLVTGKTDPDWEPVMKKAAAIVTDRGARTCHAAIVSRELGVPAVVGSETATAILKDGQVVTKCCAQGDTGFVYAGRLRFEVDHVDRRAVARPKTLVMLNVGDPRQAFALASIPADGVGLARVEFIIATSIRVHPMALVDYDRLEDRPLRAEIDRLTAGYRDKPQFFVDRLAEGVATIAAAFYPRDVIVRFSDFKWNEYANLLGGRGYEIAEENPMLGFRGASRYCRPRYRAAFGLECRAMRKVRDEMGLSNVKLMIPFCRTPEEGRRVLGEMAAHGLHRGGGGLEVYVMCKFASNVILANAFADVFDGFSIGSNDLTQLVLGVDRDSEIVADDFDERNPAVMKMIAAVIRTARARGRAIGICGQAPSDYPELARFLVEQGIGSIPLSPDAVLKTLSVIAEAERARGDAAGRPASRSSLEPEGVRAGAGGDPCVA